MGDIFDDIGAWAVASTVAFAMVAGWFAGLPDRGLITVSQKPIQFAINYVGVR